ncbi:MAG: PilW family protein [Steroidobacteraceae bacterium]
MSRGYSLIELMIAMLIALFLLAGLLLIVQNMRSTYNTQNQVAQLEDGERLAMMLASDVIQAAGYFPDPADNQASTAFPAYGAFASSQAVTGSYAGAAPGDSISVRFMTANNDSIINCTGGTNKTGADATYINTFSVDAQGNLDCTLTTNGTAAPAVPLVSGVNNFQVWYGVTTNPASADNNVDTYLTAAQMNLTPSYWLAVTAVKVRITFANPIASQTGGTPTVNYIESVMDVMARAGATT